MTTDVLEVTDLSIEYRTEHGALPAIRNVSFTIAPHESLGLVGESGSGKSTLAMGAIRYLAANGRVVSGSVRLNGQDVLGLSDKEMRRLWATQIGVVYQSPLSALNPSLPIGRQLAEVCRVNLGMDASAAREKAIDMLTRVAMRDPDSVMRSYPHQLSGGMLQRCVIAMALLTQPSLLIMDEPTTALDVTTQAIVLDLVAQLKDEVDSAILYITHDLGVITRICDRVGVMYAGEFFEQAQLDELFRRPRHPYTLELLGCVPKLERGGARRKLVTIPGSIPRVDALPPGCTFAPRCEFVEEACTSERPLLRTYADSASASVRLSSCLRAHFVPPPDEYVCRAVDALPRQEHVARDGQPLLQATALKTYFKPAGRFAGARTRGTVKAVDGVDLELGAGRTLGVVGESGSGKTTVARAIAGLTPATEGSVLMGGCELAGKVRKRTRAQQRSVQMVFQNPDASLNPHRTVGEQLARPARLLARCDAATARERAKDLLAAVALPSSYLHRLPAELSGGEKQRVAVARAFAAEPSLVLCDEPISSLDVSVQGALMNLLMDLQEAEGASFLFISHDLSAVQHLSDTIAVMYLGRVVETGMAAEVLSPPFHPYTEALLSAVPVADPHLQQAPIRLRGSVPSALDPPAGCRFHPRCPRVLGEVCGKVEPPWRAASETHSLCCHIELDVLAVLQADTLIGGEGVEC